MNVSANFIEDEWPVAGLPSLTEIDLSDNRLDYVSGLLGHTGLTALDVSGNPSVHQRDLLEVIRRNPGLRRLGLRDIPLDDPWSLPLYDPSTGEYYPLVELDLRNTGLQMIDMLSGLRELRVLDVSQNQLTAIYILEYLPELREIDVSDNKLSSPFELSLARNLTSIDIGGNPRIDPRDALGVLGLFALKHAGLRGFDIESLDEFFFYPISTNTFYDGLVSLDLEDTGVRDIGQLQEFPVLEKLRLGGNRISDLQPLAGLERLAELDLSENRLDDVSALSGLMQLRELRLGGNIDLELDEDLRNILLNNESLAVLSLADIPIGDIREIPLQSFDYDYRPYVALDLSRTGLTNVDDLVEITSLQELNLSGNDLRGVPVRERLKSLDVSDNASFDVDTLEFVTGLTHLDISGTKPIFSYRLNDVLARNRHLVRLGLRGLPIQRLENLILYDSETWKAYPLVELDVSDTQITTLSSLREFSSLKRLSAADNTLVEYDFATYGRSLLERLNLRNTGLLGYSTALERLSSLSTFSDIFSRVSPVLPPNSSGTSICPVILGLFASSPTQLEVLGLSNVGLTNVEELRALDTLEELYVSNNRIEDLSPLADLGRLTLLDASDNTLTGPQDLASLKSLTHLSLSGNSAIELPELDAILANNPRISHLGLRDIPTGDLFLLSPFNYGAPHRLLQLDVSNNGLVDIRALWEQPEIKYLGLRDNDLTLLDPLFGLMLRDVDLRGNDRILCVDLDRLDEIQGEGVVQRPDPCFAPNTPPEVSISSPTPPVTVAEGDVLVLEALALDAEDGDISDAIQWVSQLDGDLGGGSSLRVALTPGESFVGCHRLRQWRAPGLGNGGSKCITWTRHPSSGSDTRPSSRRRGRPLDLPRLDGDRGKWSLRARRELRAAIFGSSLRFRRWHPCPRLAAASACRERGDVYPGGARPRTALLLQAQSGRRRRQL